MTSQASEEAANLAIDAVKIAIRATGARDIALDYDRFELRVVDGEARFADGRSYPIELLLCLPRLRTAWSVLDWPHRGDEPAATVSWVESESVTNARLTTRGETSMEDLDRDHWRYSWRITESKPSEHRAAVVRASEQFLQQLAKSCRRSVDDDLAALRSSPMPMGSVLESFEAEFPTKKNPTVVDLLTTIVGIDGDRRHELREEVVREGDRVARWMAHQIDRNAEFAESAAARGYSVDTLVAMTASGAQARVTSLMRRGRPAQSAEAVAPGARLQRWPELDHEDAITLLKDAASIRQTIQARRPGREVG